MNLRLRHAPVFGALLYGLALLPGCGEGRPALVKASGSIIIDGKALEKGYIQVLPANARPATATIKPGGQFVLGTFTEDDGVVPGKHKVTVVSVDEANGMRTFGCPASYGDPLTSGLEITVDEPTDTLLLQLSWKGQKPVVEKVIKEF